MDKKRNCPVCGKFADTSAVEKYEARAREHDELLRSHKVMENEQKRLMEVIDELSKENRRLVRENEYLRNRGFFKRLFDI